MISTNDLLIKATERLAYAYMDPRAIWMNEKDVLDLRHLFVTIFPFEAMLRGYDMTLFKRPWRSYGGRI